MNISSRSGARVLAALFVAALTMVCAQSNSTPATPDPATSSCGTVSVKGPNPPADPAASKAESCFLTAYQACRPASLTVVDMGVDVTSTMTFSVHSTGLAACGIDGTIVTTFVPSRQQTSSFSCTRVTSQNGGLLFVACGSLGDVFVPPPSS